MDNLDITEDGRLYLQMMQDNIIRMATNSANAKTWLVTIVAAFLAMSCNINNFDYWLLLAIAPICVFWYLDAYYLNIERGLRNREQRFINICKSVILDDEDITIKASNDFKVYVMLLVAVLLITGIVNDWSLSELFMNFLTSE